MSDTDALCERADRTYAAILRLMEESAIRVEQTVCILNQCSVGQQQTLDLLRCSIQLLERAGKRSSVFHRITTVGQEVPAQGTSAPVDRF